MTTPAPRHEPVMLHEVLDGLAVHPGGRYIDATVGLGGHASAILEAASPNGALLGLDVDPEALALARERLSGFGEAAVLVRSHYREIEAVAVAHGFAEVDGVLFDLGVSSAQIDAFGRGFSFQRDEPLDMRMDPDGELTAAEVVNEYEESELAALLRRGEEPRARAIARAIVAARPLTTTGDLVRAVEQAVGRGRERHVNPATLTFQALRIEVNQELDFLMDALSAACGLLRGAGARLVVLSFHSLEDRIVKEFMRRESRDCVCPPRTPACICGHRASLRVITRRVEKPSADEVARNPRARSARLRVAEALAGPAAA